MLAARPTHPHPGTAGRTAPATPTGPRVEVFQPVGRRIARRAVAKARPGSIIIFHEGFDARGGNRASTVEAVRLNVDALAARGFRFVTVDELLSVPAHR